jgi:hypothetical protein
MSTAITSLPAEHWLRLSCVDWNTYTSLLRIFAERPGIRLTYDRGELEIMAPLLTPARVMEFLQVARAAGDQNAVTRQLRAWIRESKGS